jgi:AcrR family transcriptional regulator
VVRAPGEGPDSGALARREQIVEAARAVIEEYGPDALTGQIAERAGLARPNVYRHFSSKDELDLAVARNAYHELRTEVLTRMARSGTALDVIRAPISAQVIWADRSSQQREEERRDFAADLAVAGEHYFPHFADNPGLAAALIVALGGLIDASILSWLNRKTEPRKRLIDRLTTQAWLIIDHHLRDAGVHVDPDVPLPQMGQTGS